MSKLSLWKITVFLCICCAAAAIRSSAQAFKSIYSFCPPANCPNGDGQNPYYGPLVQGLDGNLYGTTIAGGAYGAGAVFKISPSGVMTTIYSFCAQTNCPDGYNPTAGLAVAPNGTLYGTTLQGGDNLCDFPYGCGTVFKITPAGVLTNLHVFNQYDGNGAGPEGGLTLGPNGNFYGTTGLTGGDGTIFEITPGGAMTTLHYFTETDGFGPFGALTLGVNGNFYGTTYYGGTSLACNDGCGAIFQITPGGSFTSLFSFDVTNGANPVGGLVQTANGNLYGTTAAGGTSAYCFQGITYCGTVFQLTPAKQLTTLYNFCSLPGCFDGATPFGTLMQATDGNLYGTTYIGGANSTACGYDCGTVFRITTGGTLSTLHRFNGTDGDYPYAGLVQATNGILYGTTHSGGTGGCNYGCGTVFSEALKLAPFVETVPASGKVGAAVTILGNSLKGATSVTFNGVAAAFTASNSNIKTTVPAGATTGYVQVTTPSGTLTSNLQFRVR